jgi:hypothetical protein
VTPETKVTYVVIRKGKPDVVLAVFTTRAEANDLRDRMGAGFRVRRATLRIFEK